MRRDGCYFGLAGFCRCEVDDRVGRPWESGHGNRGNDGLWGVLGSGVNV